MKRLINKIATRKFVLQVANDHASQQPLPDKSVDSNGRTWHYSRCGSNLKKFNSVSIDFIESLDSDFRRMIVDKLKKNPPTGKTVK